MALKKESQLALIFETLDPFVTCTNAGIVAANAENIVVVNFRLGLNKWIDALARIA